ncbi:MAG TPA: SCP2 sterol-binding domain-containing protein [Acidimicrobiales bacterium]|nr:SCP2 sterol-binding domain-containing protein [Acidimicrobiales bacterium]
MADFLSNEWFRELNDTLANAEPIPADLDQPTVLVVIEFADAPSNGPHAITFSISPEGARVDSGDHLAADAIVEISFADASALTSGDIDSASALREGRIKVRGDINAIVPLLTWLQRAHPNAN